MPANSFKTISDDLLHIAADVEAYFLEHGYDVKIEERVLGFPFTPAMVANRGHETIIVEVGSILDKKRVERWTRYGKSQTGDTRISLVLRRTAGVDQAEVAYAHQTRIGLMSHNDQEMIELRPPSDLAVQVVLPDVGDLNKKVRAVLAGAFKKFDTDWRDGLGDAYNAVEQEARDYLKLGITTQRVSIDKTRKGVVVGQVSADEVDAMTLGALKDAFAKIQKRNYSDEIIYSTLNLINKTRVGLAHKKKVSRRGGPVANSSR